MENNLIDKLEITNQDSGLVSLASTYGLGKSTLLAVIAAEFYYDGKNVLFLTDDVKEETIIRKVKKALQGSKPNLNMVTLTAKRYVNLEEDIKTQLNAKDYAVIIVDGLIVDFDFLRRLSFDTKAMVITTHQQQRNITKNILEIKPSDVLMKSDMLLTLSVKEGFTFFEEVKYFFCFWLKKPNRSLKILKNRYGKDGVSVDLHIDFENVKIN